MSDSPIRILQVFGSLNLGGAESRMMDIYRNIDLAEFQFDFVTLTSEKQFFEDEIDKLGGNIYKVKSPREIGIRKHVRELRECIRKGKYSAVHAHTSYHCGMVMLAAWLEHVPVRISHARTTGSKRKSKAKDISLILGRRLIQSFSTKRLAVTKEAGKFLFGKSNFEVLPNAVDIKKFQNVDSETIEGIKQEIGIKESDFVVGQIGRFETMKNHTFTINWFSEFVKKHTNSKLVFVGDGPLREEITAHINSMGLSEKVIFTGIRNDVYKVIHTFNVVLLPSFYEGLSGVVIEAQASGIPVVASDTISTESDMGLGLLRLESLQDDLSCWDEAVIISGNLKKTPNDLINKKFEENGFTLSAEIKRLSEIYRGFSS